MASQDETSSFRVKINVIDYVMVEPGPLDSPDGSHNVKHRQVPVLRIFGDTINGQKACVHVHQVWPYFYVEYTGSLKPESVNKYIERLQSALNHALSVSLKRKDPTKARFVRAIVLVKGIHFYGLHSGYAPFLKIYMIHPDKVSRAILILQSGSIMGTRMNVYEGHLSYPLQFLCDFNLYGCSWIEIRDPYFRRGPEEDEDEDTEHKLYYPVTTMPMELDVAAYNIMNRTSVEPRHLHHKLRIPALPERGEPLVSSVRELWEDERKRRIEKGLDPTPVLPTDNPSNDRSPGGDWTGIEYLRDKLQARIKSEEGKEPLRESKSWQKWVMNTFESVQALWERPYKTWLPSRDSHSQTDEENPFNQPSGETNKIDRDRDAEIDENILNSQTWDMAEHEEGWHENQSDISDRDQEIPEDGPQPELQWTPSKLPHLSAVERQDDPNPSGSTPVLDSVGSSPYMSINGSTTPQNETQDTWQTPTQSYHGTADLTFTDSYQPVSYNTPPLASHAQHNFQPANGLGSPKLYSIPSSHIMNSQNGHNIPSQKNPMSGNSTLDQNILNRNTEEESIPGLSLPVKSNTSKGRQVVGPSPQLLEIEDVFFVHSSSGKDKSRKRKSLTPPNTQRPSKKARVDAEIPPTYQKPTKSLASDIALAPNGLSNGLTSIAKKRSNNSFEYSIPPPSRGELSVSLAALAVASKIYCDPYYSNIQDIPEQAREHGGRRFVLKGGDMASLEPWETEDDANTSPSSSPSSVGSTESANVEREMLQSNGVRGWEYASMPPSRRETEIWLKESRSQRLAEIKKRQKQSQIEGPSQYDSFVPRYHPQPASSPSNEFQSMSILCLEALVLTDKPAFDPENDEIHGLAWCFDDGSPVYADTDPRAHYRSGFLVIQSENLEVSRLRDHRLQIFESEMELINFMIDEVQELDPDILVGWEIQNTSWGYFIKRAMSYGVDAIDLLGRAPTKIASLSTDNWSTRHTSNLKIAGRHVLNGWRLMRTELTLGIYTLEHVVHHVFKQRIPKYGNETLKKWITCGSPAQSSRALLYIADRASIVLELLDETRVITKTAEFARVFGIDFFSVISRGSQFKVESFMLRIAKPESFVLISPSRMQVGKQNAAECIPLIMEPISAFFKAPLLVLDFQSLYPSVMVAYNYCYSTCLGRIDTFKGKNKLGVLDHLDVPVGLMEKLSPHFNVAPNGMVYVKPTVRRSLLAKMLAELLDTRVMVKEGMKLAKGNKPLLRVLDARQAALKFICNVTYGYTSATFSGRMPAVEIADSIVQSGRETLEKAIELIESTPRWGGEVVYADTDSMFIYLPGKTKEEAFLIGNDIAKTVTAANPPPIKLKFEKVYLPCVLVAKKRYVGFKYEHPDEIEPQFDAKGIETVRRDGIPAAQKMMETCLKIIFRNQNLSEVKAYCWRSWTKILEGRASVQDFIFAKEVRLGTYSDRGPPPPGAAVAMSRLADDPNDETQYGERVRYVITQAGPGDRLVDRAVAPEVLLFGRPEKQLDALYYLTRMIIPPLERIFNLMGVDVRAWFEEMPKPQKAESTDKQSDRTAIESPQMSRRRNKNNVSGLKIDRHFASNLCLICEAITTDTICQDCQESPSSTTAELMAQLRLAEKRSHDCQVVCASCSGSAPSEEIYCESLDCSWLFERVKAQKEVNFWKKVPELIADLDY